MSPGLKILIGDVREKLRELPEESVQCVVTSPPYWGLRDYGVDGQIGMEPTPWRFIEVMVEVFREVRRVLRKDGTCWVNMGDCYAGSWGAQGKEEDESLSRNQIVAAQKADSGTGSIDRTPGLKPKDLVGQPWRLAFGLQDDGWFLRQDIIWHKPNPMPESIRDRCTKAHEYIFLLSRSRRYYFDAEAIKEPCTGNSHPRGHGVNPKAETGVGWGYAEGEERHKRVPAGWKTDGSSDHSAKTHYREKAAGKNSRMNVDRDPQHQTEAKIRAKQNRSFSAAVRGLVQTRNKRSVWSIPTQAYRGAHYATFPVAIAAPCILAGSKPGDTVLDPFGGSGTVAEVALKYARSAILIDIDARNEALMRERTAQYLIQPALPLSA